MAVSFYRNSADSLQQVLQVADHTCISRMEGGEEGMRKGRKREEERKTALFSRVSFSVH